MIGHGGLFTGHTAGLWSVPECSLVIAIYVNRGFVGQRALLDRVIQEATTGALGLGTCHPEGHPEAAEEPAGNEVPCEGQEGAGHGERGMDRSQQS